MAHKVGDLVYSNSYGLGWISKIGQSKEVGLFQRFPVGETVYTVNFEYSQIDSDSESQFYLRPDRTREYNEKGIGTMKMFLRIKERGEDV